MENRKRQIKEATPTLIVVTVAAILLLVSVALFIINAGRPESVEAATTEVTDAVETTMDIPVTPPDGLVDIESTDTTEDPSEATGEPTVEETLVPVDPESLELLAIVIYRECGADVCCDECRRRVADIVLNRVESPRFANTIRGVLTQENQYYKMWETGVVWPSMAYAPGEKHAVERAYRIAEEVLRGQHSEVYGQGYIWQALFPQGDDGFWCCGTYFGRDLEK